MNLNFLKTDTLIFKPFKEYNMYQFTEIFQNIFLTLTFSIASLEPGETCTATMSRRHSAGDISRCPDMEWWVLITQYPNSSYWWNLKMSCKMIKKNMIPVIVNHFFFNLCIPVVINSFTLKLWISNEIVSFTDIISYGYPSMNWNTDWVYMYIRNWF